MLVYGRPAGLAVARPTWAGSCWPHPVCASLGKSLPLSVLGIFPGLFPDTSLDIYEGWAGQRLSGEGGSPGF